jgi:DNA-directed RNA polymerase subunit H (RpoH/RPB5)|uniref:RNA polymerase subunit H/Rpb5 C-terminal domain-containing protein n=1 Tax=viral metagenome TaxID=1070528 RepID=A0A6C0JQN2_9ZZZZ
MSVSNNKILNIYKSRSNILEILSDNLGYDTKEYDGFSINEIDAMYSNSQLDMLVKHNDSNRKIYIKYYLTAKQIRPQNLDDIIEDLFTIESILTKEDTLIIITEDEPNDTIITKLKYLYDHDGIFVVIHNIRRLQYNILNHKLVPECTILQDKDIEDLKKKYNISNKNQLPEISRFDPQALVLCIRPGNVCELKRNSATTMFYKYYRVCV